MTRAERQREVNMEFAHGKINRRQWLWATERLSQVNVRLVKFAEETGLPIDYSETGKPPR